jgi:thiol-disulfide isomerase/thioredoxin
MKKTLLSIMLATVLYACANSNKQQTSEPSATPEATVQTKEEAAQTDAEEAPDFTLNDINGKPLTLSSLRGKYVIIDFWGSWCVWCIKGMPKMKKYYQKYQGKLEILGIDCNDPEEKWKTAVKELELPWLHVYCDESSNVLEQYSVQGFPTKLVISPEGKIINTVIGEDPAFYTYLDQLFQGK